MDASVSARKLFREFVVLAMRSCQQAEKSCPRTGRGRKPVVPDWVIGTLVVVAVAARRKTKSAQFRYSWAHAEELKALGVWPLPKRSAFFDRYLRAWRLLQVAIACEGKLAVKQKWADAESVSADKSLIAAQGPPAHRRNGRPCRVRGADLEAGWGKSEYDGWVYGYGYEAIVSSGKRGPIWPLLASVEPANRHESQMIREKVPYLPRQTKAVLADKAYDADDLTEAIEWRTDGRRTGRRFVCPLIQRSTARRPPRKAWRRTRERQTRQAHRRARAAFLKSRTGQRLYARRRVTAEPFNAWLKERFQLQQHVWHRGLNNNRTQILAAIQSYQLVLHLNQVHRRSAGSITWLIDVL
jgi:hypothetical protein